MNKINHPTFKDNRGSFTPVKLNTLDLPWSQCSVSYNEKKFTFRGMHYQESPLQTKYVKVIKGSIIDFVLDLNTKELDFTLVDENSAVLVPNTKAHGFLTLEPETIVLYLVEGEYNPNSEKSLVWSDYPSLEKEILSIIGDSELTISKKDSIGK